MPKLEEARAEIDRQTRLGQRLSGRGFPVPRDWRLITRRDGSMLAGVYRYVAGVPAPTGAREHVVLAEQIARFLTQLHSLPPALGLECGARRLALWSDRYAPLIREYGARTGPQTQAWLRRQGERLERASVSAPAPVLVHGDLQPAYVLCDERQHIVAILDFSGPQITDPALDFGRLVQHWGMRFADTVLRMYERPADAAFRDRMAIYAGVEPLRTIEAGVLRDLPHWVGRARRHLSARAAADTRRKPERASRRTSQPATSNPTGG